MKSQILAFTALLAITAPAFAETAPQVVHVGLIDPSVLKGANITGGAMMKHDMMALRADVTEVKAGKIEFQATNFSHTFQHEMIVVSVDDPTKPLPLEASVSKADENQFTSMGEVSELPAGKSGSLSVELKPGKYLLICNVPGHLMAGMSVPFTVTQ
jgi:uncharacterized cupredoxin-like copper-binding protein